MSRSATQIIGQEIKRAACLSAVFMIVVGLACLPARTQQAESTAGYTPTEAPKGKAFLKPDAAAAALYAAAKRNDEAELLVILGPDSKELIHWSEDPAERQEHRAMFTQRYEQMHRLIKEPDHTIALYVGAENWPLPVPLVEFQGAWYFDAELGRQEVRYRRIGGNEMEALEVCRTLVDAEKEYRAVAHQYTAKFTSSEGAHDGLYWKSANDATRSPIGPYLAHAGVNAPGAAHSEAFHGYYYRVFLQSPDDFAVVAFPAEYRSSGVMTFLVTQDGKGYEKDLGDQSPTTANKIASSRVDDSWKQLE